MSAPIYPQLVTLRGPGPDALPIDDTTPLAVTVVNGGAAISDANPQPVKGVGYRAAVDVTRPSNTTLYPALVVIGIADAGTPANAGSAILTFADIGPAGGHVFITDANLLIALAAVPAGMTAFRLHLYDAAPDAILDNAAFNLSSAGDRGKYLGYVDIAVPQDLGSSLYTQNPNIGKKVKLAAASTSLFGVLQTIGSFTPASGTVYSVKLHTVAA